MRVSNTKVGINVYMSEEERARVGLSSVRLAHASRHRVVVVSAEGGRHLSLSRGVWRALLPLPPRTGLPRFPVAEVGSWDCTPGERLEIQIPDNLRLYHRAHRRASSGQAALPLEAPALTPAQARDATRLMEGHLRRHPDPDRDEWFWDDYHSDESTAEEIGADPRAVAAFRQEAYGPLGREESRSALLVRRLDALEIEIAEQFAALRAYLTRRE